MPVIFASTLMSLPNIIASFAGYQGTGIGAQILNTLNSNNWFSLTNPVYSIGLVIYIVLLIFFAYFYTSITFNPIEVADNLKKEGAYIPGIRPGRATAEYLDDIMTKITLIGGTGLLIVAIIPMILMGWMHIPWAIASFFGGTSLLIIVGVALDTLRVMESHLLVRKYDGFLSHGSLRGRGGV